EGVLAEVVAERAARRLPAARPVVGVDQLPLRDGVEPVRGRRRHLVEAAEAGERLLARPGPGSPAVLRADQPEVRAEENLLRAIRRRQDVERVREGAVRARGAGREQQGPRHRPRPGAPAAALHHLLEGGAGSVERKAQPAGAEGSSTTTSASASASASASPPPTRAWQERRSLLM